MSKTTLKKCAECDKRTRQKLCKNCALITDVRQKYDIRVASDYHLTDDVFLNGIAFLHACGQFSSFVEKVWSSPEMLFIEQSTPVSQITVDEMIGKIDLFDASEDGLSKYVLSRRMKKPTRAFKINHGGK